MEAVGEKVEPNLATAPDRDGNPIGGLKFISENGWFAKNSHEALGSLHVLVEERSDYEFHDQRSFFGQSYFKSA